MTTAKVPNPVYRCVLPVVCALLAVVTGLWGETVLVDYAGQPTVGPLDAVYVSLMIALAFVVMCLITMLLAIFPGRDGGTEPADDPLPEGYLEASIGAAAHEVAPEQIVKALERAAGKEAAGRIAAERREAAALDHIAELESLLDTYRAGTAPEMQALRVRMRDEVAREAMRKVHDLGEAAERLTVALKESRDRAQADLAAKQEQLDAAAAALRAAQDEQQRILTQEVPAARAQAAHEEFHRIRIAVAAISNSGHIEVLDPMQREAVERHTERILHALDRLGPDNTSPAFGPDVLPPLDDTGSPQRAPRLASDEPPAKARDGRLRKRRAQRANK